MDNKEEVKMIQITRKKSFVGSLIPYFIFVGYLKTETDPLDPDGIWDFPEESNIKVSNGQTISFPVKHEKCCIVIWAQTATGAASGPAYYIDEGTTDIALELVTQYSWWNGSRYILKEV